MDSTLNIDLLAERDFCLESSLQFTRYFFYKRFNRKFVVGEHHIQICQALDRVVQGKTKRLIINIAPRYGKTELAVKNFMAYGLAINPAAKFIHLSYSDDLALDNSEEVRDIVSMPEYYQLFGVKIKRNSDAKKKWYTTETGGVYATSAGGQVTGFGAGRVDEDEDYTIEQNDNLFGGALIIDDPIKPDDADSDLIRERINQRFDSTIRNRVNSRNTPIIIIMQRLHERDLCGYLLEQEASDWEVLSLPSIKADGTALWPFKHTIEELRRIEQLNKIVFERQHLQNPTPREGLLYPQDELNFYKPSEMLDKAFESTFAYGDVADQGDDSFSFPIGSNVKDKIYIRKWLHNDQGHNITEPLCSAACKELKVTHARIEANNQGSIYCDNVEKITPGTQFFKAHANTNKHSRILGEESFIKRNVYFLHPDLWDEDYRKAMTECMKYLRKGKVKHDDAPDALTGLCHFFRGMLSHWE